MAVENCSHCGKRCVPVELDEETLMDIDYHGVACLQEVDQAVYEGIAICTQCYYKEKGL